MSDRERWALLIALLAGVWLLVPPAGIPLYDGVGFPDEPYRSVPRSGADVPAATTAEVRLKLQDGVNQGGLVANSAEQGPQVSVFAPPQKFQVAGASAGAEVVLRVEPVVPVQPPRGRLQSNLYRLSLSSSAGAVTVNPAAQPLGITLRARNANPGSLPVMQYRAGPDAAWQVLETRQVGQDNFNAPGPGVGDYILTPVPPRTSGKTSTTAILVIVGLALAFVVAVLIGVRRLNRVRAAS